MARFFSLVVRISRMGRETNNARFPLCHSNNNGKEPGVPPYFLHRASGHWRSNACGSCSRFRRPGNPLSTNEAGQAPFRTATLAAERARNGRSYGLTPWTAGIAGFGGRAVAGHPLWVGTEGNAGGLCAAFAGGGDEPFGMATPELPAVDASSFAKIT